MIALSFLRTFIGALLSRRPSAVARRLQPRLRRLRAALPARDLIHMLERQADIVEALEQPRTVRGGNFTQYIRAAAATDLQCHQIYGKLRLANCRHSARAESIDRPRG